MLRTIPTGIQRQYAGGSHLPAIVYYNASIINGKSIDEGEGSDPRTSFNEVRDTPIVESAGDYFFSIIRATIDGPGHDVPLFIPAIQTGQPDINLTEYYVSLRADVSYNIGGTDYTETFTQTLPVTYQSESLSAPLPNPPLTVQDLGTEYYYVYTYSHWVDLVNRTIAAAKVLMDTSFNAWYASKGGVGTPGLTTRAPKFQYSSSSGLFSLYADTYGFGEGDRTSAGSTADEEFHIYLNSNLYGLFANFDNEYLGGDLSSKNFSGFDFVSNEILVKNLNGSNIVSEINPATGAVYGTPRVDYVMTQDFGSTGQLWSPVESLVFTTTLIPIVTEGVGQPVAFGEGNVLQAIGSASVFTPIITDIAVFKDNAHGYKQFVEYAPTAEYRLSELTGKGTPIVNLDIQVYWKNRLDGALVPLKMFNQSTVSVKMMFIRKDLYEKM